jgi:hypothetical protein
MEQSQVKQIEVLGWKYYLLVCYDDFLAMMKARSHWVKKPVSIALRSYSTPRIFVTSTNKTLCKG